MVDDYSDSRDGFSGECIKITFDELLDASDCYYDWCLDDDEWIPE